MYGETILTVCNLDEEKNCNAIDPLVFESLAWCCSLYAVAPKNLLTLTQSTNQR